MSSSCFPSALPVEGLTEQTCKSFLICAKLKCIRDSRPALLYLRCMVPPTPSCTSSLSFRETWKSIEQSKKNTYGGPLMSKKKTYRGPLQRDFIFTHKRSTVRIFFAHKRSTVRIFFHHSTACKYMLSTTKICFPYSMDCVGVLRGEGREKK